MAAKFEVDTTKSDLHAFFPDEIVIKPSLNGRMELPDIDWLIVLILRQGQLQNCLVRRESGKPVLGVGFSRWRAVSTINKMLADGKARKEFCERNGISDVLGGEYFPDGPMRLKCMFKEWSEQQMFLANIAENKGRNQTTLLDDAHNCARLEKWGKSVDEIAAVYKCSNAWVKKCLKIASAEPEVFKAFHDGKIKENAVAAIAKLSAEQQRDAAEKGIVPKKAKSPAPSKGELKSWLEKPEVPDSFKSLLKFFLGLAPRSEAQAEFDWIPNKGKKDAKKES